MKTLILLILCLYLSACSFGSTAYKHFDYVVLWYAADYVRLNKVQKSELSKATNAFIKWHKKNELAKYQHLLSEFKQDIKQQKMTPLRAHYYRQKIRLFLNNVSVYLEPNLTPLIATLTDKQYQQILSALTKEINETDKDDNTLEKKLNRMQKSTEDWYGDLTQEQLSILNHINQKRVSQRPIWKEKNRHWLNELAQASMKQGDARVDEIRHIILSSLEPSDNNDYSEREEWFTVWTLSTNTQREAILLKLSEYQTLLDDISNK